MSNDIFTQILKRFMFFVIFPSFWIFPAKYLKRLHPGRCSTFHSQAWLSPRPAFKRGPGVPGPGAECPLFAPGTQHAKGH